MDCSVTPGVDWGRNPGDPNGNGGSNYAAFPARPYFLNPADISAPAPGGLLEVPMTILPSRLYRKASWMYRVRLVRRAANRVSPGLSWLCPTQPSLSEPLDRNLDVMMAMARTARIEGVAHMEFMLHSSDLMPGGSPDFKSTSDIDRLYERLEMLFEELSTWCSSMTLAEFRDQWMRSPHKSRAIGPAGRHVDRRVRSMRPGNSAPGPARVDKRRVPG